MEVHHVAELAELAELADLGRSGNRPPWADLMAARHRKTLVACGSCHPDIHGTRPVPALTEQSLESDVRRKSYASFELGAAGKRPAQQAPRRRPTSTLLQNLWTAVEKTCRGHRDCLRQPAAGDFDQ
ncbi:hypothetical protein ABT404_06140 [Streptomyces hyaluromycini]|uniref:AI2M/AI1M-like HNH endonuclease domain-containing protein n=1 Tax=Streptomyces hyaluromycini TaxID=1377993 RepID=A0ABV1WRL0_9ACTN